MPGLEQWQREPRSLAVHQKALHQLALADRRVSEQNDFDAVSR